MGNADLGFLVPLFTLAATQHHGQFIGDVAETHPQSSLGRDDALLDGYWATTLIRASITAGVDQLWSLRTVVESGSVGNHGLWATMRAALENFSSAACLVATPNRADRLALTLSMWDYDYRERRKWERDHGSDQGVKAVETKLGRIAERADRLDVRLSSASVGYGELVYNAAALAGHQEPSVARAHWRVASGFAHGRLWPALHLSTPESARPIVGGLATAFTLDESKFQEIAEVTGLIGQLAIDRFNQRRQP